MLISHDKKFLFIHIQRTAGTSLSHLLTRQVPDIQSFLSTHDHAAWAKAELAADWDAYFTFAFVRNPWERLVSWYSLIMQARAQYTWYRRLLGRQPNQLWQYVWDTASTFEEFIMHCTETIEDTDGRKSFVYNQLDYVADVHGHILVDCIGRYETLDYDVRRICTRLGLDPTALAQVHPSRHPHYRTFYTAETRQIVHERYARDITAFGYVFDTDGSG